MMFRSNNSKVRQVRVTARFFLAMSLVFAGGGKAFAVPGLSQVFQISGLNGGNGNSGSGNGTSAKDLEFPKPNDGEIEFEKYSTSIKKSSLPLTSEVLRGQTLTASSSASNLGIAKSAGTAAKPDDPLSVQSQADISHSISVSDPITSLTSAANLDTVAASTSDLFNSVTFQSIAATAFTDSGAYAALAGTIDLGGRINQNLYEEYNRIMADCEKGGGRGSDFCEGLLGCVAKLAKSSTSVTEARIACLTNPKMAKVTDSTDAQAAATNSGTTGTGTTGTTGSPGSAEVLLSSLLFDAITGGDTTADAKANIEKLKEEFIRLFGDVKFTQEEVTSGNGTVVAIKGRNLEPVLDGALDCAKPLTLSGAAWCHGNYVFDLLRWVATAQCVYFNDNAIDDLTQFNPMKPRGSQVGSGGSSSSWGTGAQIDEYGPWGTNLKNWTRAVSDLSFDNFSFSKTLGEAFFWQFKKGTFRSGNGLIQQISNFTSGNMLTGSVKLDCAPLADSASDGLTFGDIYCRKNQNDPICTAGGGSTGSNNDRIPVWAEMMYTYSLARAYLHKRALAEQAVQFLNQTSNRLDHSKTVKAFELIKKQWQDGDAARLTTYLSEVSKMLTIMHEEYIAARSNKGGSTAGGSKRGGSKGGFNSN